MRGVGVVAGVSPSLLGRLFGLPRAAPGARGLVAWALEGKAMNANMKTVALATLAAGASLAGTSGAAHATEDWYGRVDVGHSVDGDFDVKPAGYPWAAANDVENDWVESFGLGYAFDDGVRMEGELSHRFNEVDAGPALNDGGDLHIWSAMFNAYFDFNRGGEVDPYIGFGFGSARVIVNGADSWRFFDERDVTLAYQAMAGMAFAVTPHVSLDIGYRYFATDDIEFTSFQPTRVNRRAEYNQDSVTIGLRWELEPAPAPAVFPEPAPPPPPPPEPPRAACPTQQFAVYFEWDRSNLNEAAIDAIDAAVAQMRSCTLSDIMVSGHTDTSGAANYNIGLSQRRASVVRDALAARGVPAGLVATQARGETVLARPTRDGVREPLNRRAVVTLTFQ
jgi:outer membrane protein OmpA-like peptidoglycan-associated protein